MELLRKVENLGVYNYYRKCLHYMKKNNIDFSYDEKIKGIIPILDLKYGRIVLPERNIMYVDIEEEELDDFLVSFFEEIFTKERRLLYKRIINSKIIDSRSFQNETTVEGDNFEVVLSSYKNFQDTVSLMHEIIHVFVAQTPNPYIDSEVMSRIFELIVSYELDNCSIDVDHLKYRVNNQLLSLLYSIDLMNLYPSIDPILMPYIKADYLAYQAFLLYLDNKKEFIKDVDKIFTSTISIDDFLNKNDIIMDNAHVNKIFNNHQKLLNKPSKFC